jgi:hypothetical protein
MPDAAHGGSLKYGARYAVVAAVLMLKSDGALDVGTHA